MSATTTQGTGHGAVESLSTSQLDKRIINITNNYTSVGGGYMNLTGADDGDTLPEDKSFFFCHTTYMTGGFVVTLPDAEAVAGKELTFIATSIDSEYPAVISGPFGPQSEEEITTYTLYNTWVLKVVSDGTNFWRTGEYTYD